MYIAFIIVHRKGLNKENSNEYGVKEGRHVKMKTAKNRLSLNEVPDVFGPTELARILGVQVQTGYNLVKRPDFPSIKISEKKYVVDKQSFIRWMEAQGKQKDV